MGEGETVNLADVRLADVDDISKLEHAGRFPGIYIVLQVPTGYFVESVRGEATGSVFLTLRRRFGK